MSMKSLMPQSNEAIPDGITYDHPQETLDNRQSSGSDKFTKRVSIEMEDVLCLGPLPPRKGGGGNLERDNNSANNDGYGSEDSSDDEYVVRNTGPLKPMPMDETTLRIEATILSQLHQEILRTEEADILDDLDYGIRVEESLQRSLHLPSKVSNVTTPNDERLSDAFHEELPPLRKLPVKRRILRKSRLLSLDKKDICTAKYRFPQEAGDGTSIFTRSEFYTGVIVPVEHALRAKDPFLQMSIFIKCKRNSLVLQYRGNRIGIERIIRRAKVWVEYRLNMHNLDSLLSDPESLLIDVPIGTQQRLGGSVNNFDCLGLPHKQQIPSAGVWFRAVNPDLGLAKILGMSAFEAGCAITAINWSPVSSQGALLAQLTGAADKRGEMIVSLCLSKYANVSKVDRIQHRLRRCDGRAFIPDYYNDLRVEWLTYNCESAQVSEQKNANQSWLEYPLKKLTVPSTLPKCAPRTLQECYHARATILSDKKSVEVDLTLTPEMPPCFEIFDFSELEGGTDGVWCTNIKSESQLSRTLGRKAVKLGLVLLKANGVRIQYREQLAQIQDSARHGDGSVRVTLVLFNGIDLSGINKTNLLQGRTNPRRRNGDPYPLHLSPPRKARLASGSGKKRSMNSTTALEPPRKLRRVGTGQNEDAVHDTLFPLTSKDGEKSSHASRISKSQGSTGEDNKEDFADSHENGVSMTPPLQQGMRVNEAQEKLGVDGHGLALVDSSDEDDMVLADFRKKSKKVQKVNALSSKTNTDKETGGPSVVEQPNAARQVDQGSGLKSVKVQVYHNFKTKYRSAAEIEFGCTEINMHTVFSSMWAQHKCLMGADEVCDEKCKCVGKLNVLAKNVIHAFAEEQKKKGVEVNTESIERVGFFSNFARRFLPRLSEEYPMETPQQLLFRLVEMWPFHKKQRRYGLHCHEDCDCDDGWEEVFGKGDVEKALGKCHPQKPNAVDGRKSKEQAPINISRKSQNIQAPLQNPQLRKIALSSLVAKPAVPPPLEGFENPGMKPALPPTSQDRFAIEFDATSPLGLYFINTGKKCVVHSVDPSGQARAPGFPQRVKQGDFVLAVNVGGITTTVSDFETLKQKYIAARKMGGKLSIKFCSSGQSSSSPTSHRDWSSGGVWQGGLLNGWMGYIDKEIEHGQQIPGQVNPLESRKQQQTKKTSTTHWKLERSYINPCHRTMPVKSSILHPKSRSRSIKKVQIAVEQNESRLYNPSTEACMHLVYDQNFGTDDSHHAKSSIVKLIAETAVNGSCHDFIDALVSDSVFVGDEAKMMELNLSIESAEAKLLEKPLNMSEHQQLMMDFQAKKTVMKIHMASSHWIAMAMSLTNWTMLEIKINSIEVKRKVGVTCAGMFSGSASVHVQGQEPEILGELPTRSLSEFTLYHEYEGKFKAFNNMHLRREKRVFALELKEGAEGQTQVAPLGTCNLALDQMDMLCPMYNVAVIHTQAITPCGPLLSGNVVFTVKRVKVDATWMHKKKVEVEHGLNDQIQCIGRFKQDYPEERYGNLSGHIQAAGGATLLHAAINLQNEEMVESLVKLGVRPLERSQFGTALGLAVKYKEQVFEKVQIMKEKQFESRNIHRSEALYHKYQHIVDMLKVVQTDLERNDRIIPLGMEQPSTMEESSLKTGGVSDNVKNMSGIHESNECSQQHESLLDYEAIFREVLLECKPPHGYEQGTAAKENELRFRLRISKYGLHFPKKSRRVDDLLTHVAASGIGMRTKARVWVLLPPADSHLISNSSTESRHLQLATNKDCKKADIAETGVVERKPVQRPPKLPKDDVLFQRILNECRTPPGYEHGTAAKESEFRGRIRRSRYGDHFPKMDPRLNAFLKRVIEARIAKRSNGLLVLL